MRYPKTLKISTSEHYSSEVGIDRLEKRLGGRQI